MGSEIKNGHRFSESGIQFVQNILRECVAETPEDQGGEYLAELLVNVDEVHEIFPRTLNSFDTGTEMW